MADNLGISEAQILGLFLASVFWGIFLVTFFQCMRHLVWDAKGDLRPAKTINWPMFCVAMLLAFFSTFDVALGLMHAIEAFIEYHGPGGSDARFTGLTDWVNIMKVSDYCWLFVRCVDLLLIMVAYFSDLQCYLWQTHQ